jgi:uncharacterized UBP type Zn finger protein
MRPLTSTSTCAHIPEESVAPRAQTCEGCGSSFNLRVCAHCGFVGCCESRLGHNRAHALAAEHPVLRSLPLGPGSFTWCYQCRRYVDASEL